MNFLLSLFVFALLSFFLFTAPGVYLLTRSSQKFLFVEKLVLGTIVGFVIFTLLSYILIVINRTILIPILLVIFNMLAAKESRHFIKDFRNFATSFKRVSFKGLVVSIILTIGIIGQLAVISPSGIIKNGDILFWSSHGHDGMWHVALMEEIKRGGILQNPIFSGERLVNYHFFSDVAPAVFSKYISFSNLDLYFRLFPLLYSPLLGGSAYILVKKMTGKASNALWATFFTYFAGSFGYIVTYLKNGSIGGESIFWATQIQSSSGNPPQIISNFLVLTFIYFFYILAKKADTKIFLLTAVLLGSLALFKVYAAVVLITPTLIVGAWQLIREKRVYFLSLAVIGAAFGGVLYIPNVTLGTSFLIFEPWWYIRTMIVEPARLNWIDHELRRQTYIFENNWKRVIFLEIQAFLIFFFGNLGTRIIALGYFVKLVGQSLVDKFKLLFILIIVTSLIFPLLFLQRGVASNTSQSLQYFILLFGILAGITVSKIIESFKVGPLKIVAALLVVSLTIPTQVGLLLEFYSRTAYAKISESEVEALEFIRENSPKNSVILTPPYDPHRDLGGKIPEIWDWFDTSYVSALSERRTYFDDYEQLDIMGYDIKNRTEIKKAIFSSSDKNLVQNKISETGVHLIYFPKSLKPRASLFELNSSRIYENHDVEVWKID